jgi:hypothetical protein
MLERPLQNLSNRLDQLRGAFAPREFLAGLVGQVLDLACSSG